MQPSVLESACPAYRKIGAAKRTDAVIWGIDNGFRPDTLRTIDPALLLRPATVPRSTP
jgi:hypothetical protein